jgi:RNA ligase (TIGR02306 family)
LVVFAEIDSLFPAKPEYEFLKDVNYRIRTRRFRKTISQGLVLPLSVLDGLKHESDTRDSPAYAFKEGDDVTSLLGVTLYQPPIPACLSGKIKGAFPGFLVKTDQTRVQVLANVLARHEGLPCVISEKIDGSSMTAYFNYGEFGVCSRNLELYETEDNSFWKMARKYKIEEMLRAYGKNIAIQGEVYGEGINGNPLKIKGQDFAVFDIFDIDKFKYLSWHEYMLTLFNLANEGEAYLNSVPIISESHLLVGDPAVYIEMAKGNSEINPNCKREGIVIRLRAEAMDMEMSKSFGNGRVTFKSVSAEYILQNEQ